MCCAMLCCALFSVLKYSVVLYSVTVKAECVLTTDSDLSLKSELRSHSHSLPSILLHTYLSYLPQSPRSPKHTHTHTHTHLEQFGSRQQESQQVSVQHTGTHVPSIVLTLTLASCTWSSFSMCYSPMASVTVCCGGLCCRLFFTLILQLSLRSAVVSGPHSLLPYSLFLPLLCFLHLPILLSLFIPLLYSLS